MALFKIFKGNSSNLPSEMHDGYCYFTMDDGIFYIDYLDTDGVTLKRKPISGPGKSIEYVPGQQTASTNVWLGTTKDEALYTGKIIAYRLPYDGTTSAATLNLTLGNNTQTGAIAVKRKGSENVTNYYKAGEVIFLTYDGTFWQVNADYYRDSNDTTTGYSRFAYGRFAPTTALYRYQLLLSHPTDSSKVIPLNTTSNNTGTAKTTITTASFNPFEPIYYYSATSTVNANALIEVNYLWNAYSQIHIKYSFNTGDTLTANKDVYLVAQMQSDGSAKLRNPGATGANASAQATGANAGPISQVLPTFDDGYIYIKLGHATDSYRVSLTLDHPIYKYVDGKVQPWAPYAEKTKQTMTLTNPNKLIQTVEENGNTVLKTIENSYVDYETGKITLGINAKLTNNETLYVSGSVAEGADTEANNYSHAEGDSSIATGQSSHAEGISTIASGMASHAEGTNTRALGPQSHAEGFGDGASQSSFQANINGVFITGTGSDVNKNFYIGEIIQYNNSLRYIIGNGGSLKQGILDNSFSSSALNNVTCISYDGFTIAIGEASHAEGYYTTAYKGYSHAEGNGAIAFGESSHAEGDSAVAYGDCSHAEGQETNTVGLGSHVEGQGERRVIIEAQVGDSEKFEYFLSTDVNLMPNKAVVEYNGKYYTIIKIIDRRTIRLDRLIENDQSFWDRITIYTNGALGEYSHAEGDKTISDGYQSHSEGKISRASGYSSHAEGGYTWAFGENSHAQGHSTKAFGRRTHTEGNKTVATVGNAHAEGVANEAQAPNAHAEGNHTKAGGKDSLGKPYGQSSHAEGELTKAFGDFSHAEGYRTKVIKGATGAHTEGRYSYASGIGAHAEGSSAALGEYSHAEGGTKCISSKDEDGNYYCVLNKESNNNMCTFVDDINGEVAGDYLSVGQVISCKGLTGVVESISSNNLEISGDLVEISLNNDFIYILPTAFGNYSHVEGQRTKAFGDQSHAEGFDTYATESSSHAEGYCTYATGRYSHAEGSATQATENSSHAEGNSTRATGQSSHAEGSVTQATGRYSHAEGYYTQATGQSSHAEGNNAKAIGQSSHAEGHYTIASKKSQHVFGEYNIEDTQGSPSTRGKYVEIVGNGTSYSIRSNARTLDWNGNEVLAGKLTVGANPTAAMDVVTKQYFENNTSDTKVKQTAKTDNVDYKLLTTVSASPTSGSAAEAGYGANLAYNPSTNTLKTGNASLAGTLNVTGQTTLNSNVTAQGITTTDLLVSGNTTFNQIPLSVTPADTSNDTSVATTEFVKRAFQANDAMVFKGTLGSGSGSIATPPASGYSAGWTYRVADAGTYAGEYCEVGDILIAIKDGPATGSSVTNADWAKIEHNIDGAVYMGHAGSAIGGATQPVYVNASGLVVAGTALGGAAYKAADYYLPLSGGIMTGGITLPGNQSSAWNDKGIIFSGGSRIGENSSGQLGLYSANKFYLHPNSGTAANGKGVEIDNTFIIPSVTNEMSLGDSSHKWTTVYATTFDGNATSASKLSNTSKIGDTNKPVYFTANGVPSAISYTIDKSVPSNAVFTDILVKQTASTTAGEYKLLATASTSPTSGAAAEAIYNTDVTINPSTKAITATTYKVTSNGTITYNASNGCLEIIV